MKKLLAKFAAISMLIGMHACQEPQNVDTTIAITTNPFEILFICFTS